MFKWQSKKEEQEEERGIRVHNADKIYCHATEITRFRSTEYIECTVNSFAREKKKKKARDNFSPFFRLTSPVFVFRSTRISFFLFMRLNKRSFPSDRNVSLAGGNRLSIFIEIKYKWLIETVNYDNYAKLTRVKGYNKKVF